MPNESAKPPRGKPVTRRTVLSRRDALTAEERAAAESTITDGVLVLLASVPKGGVIGLYAAKGSEVATTAIDARVRAAGFRVAYPIVESGARQLTFAEAQIGELVPGPYGLREPAATAARVALDAIVAFVIPGVAFDRAGGRIGWGRGHYDATLAAAPAAVRIGIAFECQVVDRVDRDPHDVLLHHVVTEVASYRS
ncbi:MAG: 5-formyltetrahydrofolate cyclo-ligase [Deltaproteobacteria bacterium]|nr:5-formyltetrahydrofolate cyclo-ligase [Deltaproteobacteria bacterium]